MAHPENKSVKELEPHVHGGDLIQLRATSASNKDTRKNYQLFIDGVLLKNVEVDTGGQATPDGIWFGLRTNDEEAFDRLGNHTLRQLPQRLNEITFLTSGIPWARSLRGISFLASYEDDDVERKNRMGQVSFDFVPSFANWKSFYAPSEYFEELSAVVESEEKIGAEWIDGTEVGGEDEFSVWFDVPIDESITELRHRSTIQLEKIHYSVEQQLSERLGKAILTYFEFPDAVKVPCEQYLLYFAQFMRDLGVEASSELRHEAGRVLFSVTPEDPQQALDKIRTALEVFLLLPSNPISDVNENNVVVNRLATAIYRLKNDLALAEALFETKEVAIQAQQWLIQHQQKALSSQLLLGPEKEYRASESNWDKEELMGGTIAISPYQGKGLMINLPDLFRRLRRFLNEKSK